MKKYKFQPEQEPIVKYYFVYILASKQNGTLYTGICNDLIRRVWQHKNKIIDGFSSEYGVDKLVYYETFNDVELAIKREKNIKKWKRSWKLRIIIENNPQWNDLYYDLVGNNGGSLPSQG
jgi:putative endonuclease